MSIGVDHINHLPVLRAKLQEMDSEISKVRSIVSSIVQNVTINVQGSNFLVINRPDEPPHPTGDETAIWRQARDGQPDVLYVSVRKSTGDRTWLWLGEAT